MEALVTKNTLQTSSPLSGGVTTIWFDSHESAMAYAKELKRTGVISKIILR